MLDTRKGQLIGNHTGIEAELPMVDAAMCRDIESHYAEVFYART